MSLPHFYLENQVIASEGTEAFPLRLSPDDAKHARALRLAPGEHGAVVDAASVAKKAQDDFLGRE